MEYISLFSGAGGLEDRRQPPILACELDRACRTVLEGRFPDSVLHDDVTTLRGRRLPNAEVVVGGWPCQDLSVAGARAGLDGTRSGLFFELLRVAKTARATTIVAENVPNLLKMDGTATFRRVLRALSDEGFSTVAWRTLNAREFGLPHQRRRVFLVASKDPEIPMRLHRRIPKTRRRKSAGRELGEASGFYTTAGIQSICYSQGFVPTLKVGSSISIPSPPGIHFDDCVRKATDAECLRLQGFDPKHFKNVRPKDRHRMAGNAVAVPVGRFVMESVRDHHAPDVAQVGMFRIGPDGALIDGELLEFEAIHRQDLSTTLRDFIDETDRESLSPRAASGLLRRLDRSGKPCPDELRSLLVEAAGQDTIRVSRNPTPSISQVTRPSNDASLDTTPLQTNTASLF